MSWPIPEIFEESVSWAERQVAEILLDNGFIIKRGLDKTLVVNGKLELVIQEIEESSLGSCFQALKYPNLIKNIEDQFLQRVPNALIIVSRSTGAMMIAWVEEHRRIPWVSPWGLWPRWDLFVWPDSVEIFQDRLAR